MFRDVLKKDRKNIIKLTIIPIFAVLALSYLFSNIYVEHIQYGIMNLDNSALSRTIVTGLKNHPGLDVCYYTNSEEDLKNAILTKRIRAGIIIPQNYGKDVREKRGTKAVVLVDATNLMIGNNASGYSSAVLSSLNAGYQLGILEGKNMLPQTALKSVGSFSLRDRTLYDPTLSYMTYVIYVVIPLLLQIFYLNQYLLPALIQEKEALAEDMITVSKVLNCLKGLMPRLWVMWVTIGCSTLMGLLGAHVLFGLPMRGNLLAHFVLMIAFLISLTIMALVMVSFLTSENFHYYISFFSIVYPLFILTSGATWPIYMMPRGFMTVVQWLWPYSYVADPFKCLHLKGIGWAILLPKLGALTVFCLAWLVIAIGLNVHWAQKQNHRISGYVSLPKQ